MNNFKLISFSQLTEQERVDFFNFCKTASLETDQPASVNMWSDEWETTPHTLPYVLLKTNRFSKDTGDFHILFCNNDIAACGGVYLSEFNKAISIAGTRTWTAKKYRHQTLIRDYILVKQKAWSIDRGCKQIAICFNNYNKNMKNIFYRNRIGEKSGRIFQRSPENLFFSNINQLAFPVNIQYTPQWVLYEKLDPAWEFDWSLLRS